jgi:hypothetical protein
MQSPGGGLLGGFRFGAAVSMSVHLPVDAGFASHALLPDGLIT